MSFDQLIEESYKGFGGSAILDLDELRLLYYGRRGVFVTFSDDGEYQKEASARELYRPMSIACFPVNDVVGRKVSSPDFYANVFRPVVAKRSIQDIRRYTREDLMADLAILKLETTMSDDEWDSFVRPTLMSATIRHPFERLWNITELVADNWGGDHARKWNTLLFDTLQYSMISDPVGLGIVALGRTPVSLFFDVNNKEDLDVLPIQKNRIDPRRHVRDRIERKVFKMRGSRNRVAKRRVDRRNLDPNFIQRTFGR